MSWVCETGPWFEAFFPDFSPPMRLPLRSDLPPPQNKFLGGCAVTRLPLPPCLSCPGKFYQPDRRLLTSIQSLRRLSFSSIYWALDPLSLTLFLFLATSEREISPHAFHDSFPTNPPQRGAMAAAPSSFLRPSSSSFSASLLRSDPLRFFSRAFRQAFNKRPSCHFPLFVPSLGIRLRPDRIITFPPCHFADAVAPVLCFSRHSRCHVDLVGPSPTDSFFQPFSPR